MCCAQAVDVMNLLFDLDGTLTDPRQGSRQELLLAGARLLCEEPSGLAAVPSLANRLRVSAVNSAPFGES